MKRKSTNIQSSNPQTIRVWDLPLRLFHWGLAASFTSVWLTRSSQWLDFHVFFGTVFLCLLIFRFVWGFIGEPTARFSHFRFAWGDVRSYLHTLMKKCAPRHLGHNPPGSWAIYGLLFLGLLIALSGVLLFGAEERHGLLRGLFDFEAGAYFHSIHEFLAWVMLVLVIVHLFGVLSESLIHRENLAAAMIHGQKARRGAHLPPVRSRAGIAFLMVLPLLPFSIYWFDGYFNQTPENPYIPFKGAELAQNALWQEACGECHLAYHPSLLPARSWKKMLAEQENHFEEDLALDAETTSELNHFQNQNSAEKRQTEASWQLLRSIPETESPLRITEIVYWKEQHIEISDSIWKNEKINGRWNCEKCHFDAEQGTFEDAAIRLP